jgi:hypothetical protein
MNLFESAKVIKSLLSEYKTAGEVNESFVDEEVSADGRMFLLTGSASATLIDDSDYNRETGYGSLTYPSDFEFNVERVIEILEDGTEVDVSDDPSVISMMEEFMKEKLENS